MREPWKAPEQAPGHLDPLSRRTARKFCLQTSFLILFVVWPYAAGIWSLPQAVTALGFSFQLVSILSAGKALLRQEHLGRGGLNHWDEALAFMAAFRFIHFVTAYGTDYPG